MELSKDDFGKYNLPKNPNDYENIELLEPTFGKSSNNRKMKRESYGSGREGNSSSYALFFREMQPFIRKKYPNATFGDLSKLIAAKWESLEEKYKKEYRRRSVKAKRDKLREMAFFKVQQLCSSSHHPPLSSSLYNQCPSKIVYKKIYEK